MKPSIYRRMRRRPASREAVSFKKDNQPEQQFFGETTHEPFFKPVAAGAQSDTVQCKEEKKEEKKVQRAADKKEEEKKVQKKEDKKEEKVMKKGDKKEEEKKVQRAADKKEEEKKVQKKEDKKEDKVMKKDEKKEEEKKVQKKEAASTASAGNNVSSYIGSLNGKGQSLPAKANNFFSSRIGYDFSNVKVHTDKEAAESAKEVNAKAYTVGKNVVFNEGQFDTLSDSGRKLLAHELVHVVQNDEVTQLEQTGIARETLDGGVDSGMDAGTPVAVPMNDEPRDAGVGPIAGVSISPIASELATLWANQGKGPFFERMRSLTIAERADGDVINFVATQLSGDDNWLATNLLLYGREINWPLNLRVEREMKGWSDSGGFYIALALIILATDADRLLVINDTALMQYFYANLSVVEKVLMGVALFNLAAIPAGVARSATALLFFSNEQIDRNTALRIANGDIQIFYIENLTHPANEAALLTANSLDPLFFTIYNHPDGSTNTISAQLNAQGFRINGTNMILGLQSLDIARWQTLLVHETNHARNLTPADQLENYKTEFRAYWVAEYRGVSNLDDRARQIKAHILADYPTINGAYTTDAVTRAAIDAHTRPDGNVTNI